MNGYLGNLNETQTLALNSFKEKLEKCCSEQPKIQKAIEEWRALASKYGEVEDSLLLRFLRARRFDVDKAMKLFTDTLIWRVDFHGVGVDNLTEDMFVNELQVGKAFVYGKDKENRPVVYIRVRLHKASTTVRSELEKMTIWCFEQARKLVKPPVETTTLIFDMSGFSMENMDYPFVKFLIDTFANRYPESFGLGLVVDAPFIFWACWKLISPLMDPVTVSKIKFVKKKEVIDHIDSEQLLAEYGGTCKFEYVYPPEEGSMTAYFDKHFWRNLESETTVETGKTEE